MCRPVHCKTTPMTTFRMDSLATRPHMQVVLAYCVLGALGAAFRLFALIALKFLRLWDSCPAHMPCRVASACLIVTMRQAHLCHVHMPSGPAMLRLHVLLSHCTMRQAHWCTVTHFYHKCALCVYKVLTTKHFRPHLRIFEQDGLCFFNVMID